MAPRSRGAAGSLTDVVAPIVVILSAISLCSAIFLLLHFLIVDWSPLQSALVSFGIVTFTLGAVYAWVNYADLRRERVEAREVLGQAHELLAAGFLVPATTEVEEADKFLSLGLRRRTGWSKRRKGAEIRVEPIDGYAISDISELTALINHFSTSGDDRAAELIRGLTLQFEHRLWLSRRVHELDSERPFRPFANDERLHAIAE